MKKLLGALTGLGLLVAGTSASAHVWNLGWKSTAGTLTFYGVSWHTGAAPLGPNTVDDFSVNPAGFVINGSNFVFDIGSVVNMNDCNGPGGLTSGSCAPVWNALNLDGALHSSIDPSGTYGKYATKTMSQMELASVGIGTGMNSVTFTTFSPNATWDSRPFSSATVPINIIVTPPCGTEGQPACPVSVPEPGSLGGMALFGLGLTGLALSRRRKNAS